MIAHSVEVDQIFVEIEYKRFFSNFGICQSSRDKKLSFHKRIPFSKDSIISALKDLKGLKVNLTISELSYKKLSNSQREGV